MEQQALVVEQALLGHSIGKLYSLLFFCIIIHTFLGRTAGFGKVEGLPCMKKNL